MKNALIIILFFISALGYAEAADSTSVSGINFRVRIQARLDVGDLLTDETDSGYISLFDTYFRRTRLEIRGHPIQPIEYTIIFSADHWERADRDHKLSMPICYVKIHASPTLTLRFGLTKLPYSRFLLTSYSRLMFVERPDFANQSSRFMSGNIPFNIQLYQSLIDSLAQIRFAVSDGFQKGDDIGDNFVVHRSDASISCRIEFSPSRWTEEKKYGSFVGVGRHLTFAAGFAAQRGIRAHNESEDPPYIIKNQERWLVELDLSAHHNGLGFQIEYINMTGKKKSEPNVNPKGICAQVGYFIKSLRLEPSFRYEYFNEDANQPDKTIQIFTSGLNWYKTRWDHDFKIQANFVHYLCDPHSEIALPNDSSKNLFYLQCQFYFR
ncbi:MAG: hypothetical protein B6244_08020 [Candidatus Cloacimonetes bacterium 4572_55]|nr:MAG: hypothetical protein B6244_08020 [Candidatus Cloacimonetes bacterium 4572_55]